jgi:8-oxo-dGTP diphosphatase
VNAPGRGGPGPPVVAVGGVAVRDGALLLVQRGTDPGRGRWSIPGGRVEPGETMAAAVERELLEETGLSVRCGDFLGWAERMGPAYHYVILDFAVTVAEGDPTPRARSDAAAASWIPLREVRALELVDGLEDFLRTHGVID